MEASVLGALLARERRSSRPALSVPERERPMSYHDYLTTAYKAGNVLRYLGISDDAVVAVDPTAAPEPILAFLGAAQLGATTTFDPDAPARLTLVPVAAEGVYNPQPGSNLAVYGGAPDSPQTTHWEKAVWSENPGFPPTSVSPDSTALLVGDDAYSHQALLTAARRVVSELQLDQDSRLAIRTSLSRPETVAGGVVASLIAESTAVFVTDPAATVDADAALVDDETTPPESTWMSLSDVPLSV